MTYMFAGATSFNQSLGEWDVSGLNSSGGAAEMFNKEAANWPGGLSIAPAGLSRLNYDATLAGWSRQNLQSGIVFGAGTSTYCNSEVQRTSIINNFNWVINDNGRDCSVDDSNEEVDATKSNNEPNQPIKTVKPTDSGSATADADILNSSVDISLQQKEDGPTRFFGRTNTLQRGDEEKILFRGWINGAAGALGIAPITVVRVLPWLFIIFLMVTVAVALLNLSKQLIIVAKMKQLVRRQELLNLEKTWLLSLSSHYLRTPLTIIKAGQELIKDGFYKDTVISGMSDLNKTIGGAIDGLRNDQIVAEMQAPKQIYYKHASLWQPKVVIPALLSLGLVVLINFVFIVGAKLNPGMVNMFSQFCVVAILAGSLYLAYDTHLEKVQVEAYQKKLLKYERGLDRARNSFVRSIAEELMPKIAAAKRVLPKKAPAIAIRNMKKGLEQLEGTTEKFLLICQLEKEELKKQAAEFGLKNTVAEAKAQSRYPDRPVELLLSEKSNLIQPEALLKKVFESLMDNAAEHSDSSVPTKVSSDEKANMVSVAVEDKGKGIEEDKLSVLFKPFSKVEEDFASQGMGISLYLNRLIMHYLGGEIRAKSRVGEGTVMTVDVPKEIA